MVDSYFSFTSNPAADENSPGFFSKQFNDLLYNFMESEPYSLVPPNKLPPINEELPQENLIEQFSHGSAYSTNPSTKHSPEYTPNEDDQDGDNADSAENEQFVPSKVPPITRKGIKKQYEPILDNGALYRYEEDPNEYRRARKRIQNRESATRVRNRKRTRAEELEDEVKLLTKEKAELKVQNAQLVAENTMLKQQVGLLERVISMNNQADIMDNSDSLNDTSRNEQLESIINLIPKPDDDNESQPSAPRYKYTRVAPAHSFKKHVATLGVFTLLLCVYGLLPRTESRTVQLFSFTKSVLSRPNSLALGLKSDVGSQDLLGNQRNGDIGISWAWMIEFLVMVAFYFGYSIYVGVKFYKYRALRKKSYAYTPL